MTRLLPYKYRIVVSWYRRARVSENRYFWIFNTVLVHIFEEGLKILGLQVKQNDTEQQEFII